MRKFKTVYMRGGTSKGCIFKKNDLPKDESLWDEIFLKVMGNPDPKQIDGMGGTVSSNNKIVVVWNSKEPEVDLEYLVGQIVVGKNQVDYSSNCGNMTSAVGPFAIQEEMVQIDEPETSLRLLNKNTMTYIDVHLPIDPETKNFAETGDCKIAGVDGTSAEIIVDFLNPMGTKTGKLFPTGKKTEIIQLPNGKAIKASLIDVTNPLVVVKAQDVGCEGIEMPDQLNDNPEVTELMEFIRTEACVRMGLAKNHSEATLKFPGIPKIAMISKPKKYASLDGSIVEEKNMDVCVRVYSVFKCHKASPVTSACALGVLCKISDTIMSEIGIIRKTDHVRLGHPSGVMTVYPKMSSSTVVTKVGAQRTSRRIMEGYVYIPN